MKSAMQGPSAHLELLDGNTAFLLMKGLELVTGLCLTSLSNSPSTGRPLPEALARPQAIGQFILQLAAAHTDSPCSSQSLPVWAGQRGGFGLGPLLCLGQAIYLLQVSFLTIKIEAATL